MTTAMEKMTSAVQAVQGAGDPRHCAHEPAGFGHCGHLGCPNAISRCAMHSTPPPYREADPGLDVVTQQHNIAIARGGRP